MGNVTYREKTELSVIDIAVGDSHKMLSNVIKVKSESEGYGRLVTNYKFGLSLIKLISYVICGVGKRLQAGGIVPQLI